jgi:hypothetical protein
LVRTQEMRMHINNLADRVEAAQRAGITTQIATKHGNIPPKGTKWALQPNSLPITIITNTNPNARSISRSQSNDRKRKNTLKVPVAVPKRSSAPPALLTTSQSRNATRSKSKRYLKLHILETVFLKVTISVHYYLTRVRRLRQVLQARQLRVEENQECLSETSQRSQ